MMSKEDLDRVEVKIALLEAARKNHKPLASGQQPPGNPMTAHELAKRLLALPDHRLVIVKGEGDGYISEYDLNPGGPWIDGKSVRLQIQLHVNPAQATAR